MIRHFAIACAFLAGLIASYSFAAEPVRVGMLGMDNYQAIEYVNFFNNPAAEGDLAGIHVTAVYPVVSPDYPQSKELTERWLGQMQTWLKPIEGKPSHKQVEVVDSIPALLAKCDAVMIWSLDGRMHLKQATEVLNAGKPLYIGRPLASNVADAVAILKLAHEKKVPCWSCSQHRFSPGFIGMRDHAEVGPVIGCDVYGGYDLKASEADAFTRSLHSIETLYTIMGPGCVKLSATSTPQAEIVTGVWKDGRVGTFRGLKVGAVKYSAMVFGEKGVSTAGVYGHGIPVKGIAPTDDKYMGYGGLAIELAKFFKTRQAPVSTEEMLEIYSFLQSADESRAQQGASVALKNLWQ